MSSKITVIIPVYNSFKFLNRCLESVIYQTFVDIEILLIDDGSTDGSSELCDAWALKDSRIFVVHQENRGVSTSRNKGLELSQSEWIMFVDSDDRLDLKAIEKLHSCIDDRVDLVFGPIINDYSIKKSDVKKFDEKIFDYDLSFFRNEFYGGCIIEPRIFKSLFSEDMRKLPFLGSPCGKIYKKSIIEHNNLRFNKNITYGEDSFFNLQYLECAKFVKYIEYPIYYYFMHSGSLSTGNIQNKNKQYNDYVDEISNITKEYQNFDKYISMDLSQMIWELSEMYGMAFRDLKEFRTFRLQLVRFVKRYQCSKALKFLKISDLPDYKHKIIVVFLKFHMFGITMLGCKVFYKICSEKNRIGEV